MTGFWNFLEWVEQTDLSVWVREGNFFVEPLSTFYIMLGFHSIGMAMVVGINFMISLRFFGFFRSFPITMANRLMKIAWWGFYINLSSGILLYIAQPRRELMTSTFNIKIFMIILAVITMVVMQRALREIEAEPSPSGTANPDGTMMATAVDVVPDKIKITALMIDIFWLGAIIAGRLIGYTQPPPP